MYLARLFNRRLASAALVACAALTPVGLATAAASPAQHAAEPTSTPTCSTSGLDVWLDTNGDGTAGHVYYDLEFTNLSGHTCTIYGYPGVSAVNLSGTQIGSAASRQGSGPKVITLRNDGTATVVLGIADTGNYPPASCQPVTAAGLRVYPPNQTRARLVPFPLSACSRPGVHFLSVQPAQNGVVR